MKKILCLLLLGGQLVTSSYAKDYVSVQSVKYDGIIAIVNGNIITAKDLNDQVKIAILSSGLKDNREMRVEILKNMVAEELKWSLLKKLAGKERWVSEKDVNAAFAQIAERNNMSVKVFTNLLKSKGINIDMFKRSININMSWIEYIKLRYNKNVNISERELRRTLKLIKEKKEKESFWVSRMVFPIMDLKDISFLKRRVENIRKMVAHGASFSELARKFSKSPDAKNGGDLGWIFEGQLSSEEYSALKKMKLGEVRVVQNSRGFYILRLKDKRDAGKDSITHLRFVQVGVPRPEYANGQDTKTLLSQLRSHYPSAKEFIKQARIIGCFVSDPVSGILEGMTHEVRGALKNCRANSLSRIISNDRAFFVFCILNRREEKIPEPTINDIRNQKINERFGVFSDKELYELKKKADIKLNSKYGKVSDFVSQL